MDIKIIYEDDDLLVVDKPAGIVVIPELIDELIKRYPELGAVGEPPRYGIVHRLDKDTSGVLLAAKTSESLIFLQNQFSPYGGSPEGRINTIEKKAEKRYIALVEGNIKDDTGIIHTLIGRAPGDKRKQKAYLLNEIGPGKREAITEYKVLERFKEYTLLEVEIKTGRKHQIRCHLSYIHHPIAGDKMYGFKNSPTPEGLIRQFLHAEYLKIKILSGEIKEFKSKLPEELNNILKNLD